MLWKYNMFFKFLFAGKSGNIQFAREKVEFGWCFSLSSSNLEEAVLASYLKELLLHFCF